jgi:cytochrome c6
MGPRLRSERSGRKLVGWILLTAGMTCATAYASDVFKGRELYTMHCANCHGQTGNGVMPGAPDLSNIQTTMQPDVALLGSLKAGKNAMPAYVGILTDRDLLDVIAFMRTLTR